MTRSNGTGTFSLRNVVWMMMSSGVLLLSLSLTATALPSYKSILGFVTPPHHIPGLTPTKRQRQERLTNWRLLRGGTAGTSSTPSTGSGSPEQAEHSTSTSTVLSLASPSQEPQSSSSAKSATSSKSASSVTTKSKSATKSPLQRLDYNASATDAGSLSLQDILAQLQTKAVVDVDLDAEADGSVVNLDFTKSGLSDTDVKARLAQYGPNELKAQPKTSMWQLIAEQFQDRLVQILLVVAVLSAVFSILQQQGTTGSATVEAESLWKALVEPSVILAILFLNAATGVWQSMSADNSLAALQKMQAVLCRVQRNNGTLTEIPAADLVPGDILMVSVGDKIAADARLISLEQSLSLQVDQGSLTGESVTVGKLPGDQGMAAPDSPVQDQKSLLFAGTMVTAGRGRAIVVQTGMDTQFGKISAGVTEAAATPVKTPLAAKLDDFGEQLTWIIGVICLAVWLVSIPKMNDPSFANVWQGGIYYAKVAVALGVAAIPEGLPAVITLCLSLGTRRMAERNVIVRKLPSVETLGCVTVICTDKTGTLTTNEMTAVSLVLLEHSNDGSQASAAVVAEHLIEGYSYSPMGIVEGVAYNAEVREHPLGAVADVAAVSALCNNAKIIGCDDADESTEEQVADKKKPTKKSKKSKGEENKKVYERVGEPTEAALCVLTEKLGGMSHYLEGGHLDRKGLHFNVPPSVLANANVMSWRDIHPRVATLEFSRDRKSMSVLCDFPEGDYPTAGELHEGARSRKAGKRLLVKGAPNLLIERCTHVKFRDGTVSKMTGPIRRSIEEKLSEMACRPLRCLALAVKDSNELEPSLREFSPTEEGDVQNHPLLSDSANYSNIESGLTLVGIVGIKDPARPEVADSITECTRAGIRVLMITGDAKDTAVAIARDVNIFPPKDSGKPIKAFEGREFFNKPVKEQLRILAEDNIVFCRAEPVDKQRLVKMLQSLGEIPAMTGDGTFCPFVFSAFDPPCALIHDIVLFSFFRCERRACSPASRHWDCHGYYRNGSLEGGC
jgi:Ca2+-transporting ATPase